MFVSITARVSTSDTLYIFEIQLIFMSRAFEPELDWSKERSLLLQRIELLQEQIGEFNKREEDNKKFSDTLMTVVNDLSNEQSRNREAELEIRNQQLQQ